MDLQIIGMISLIIALICAIIIIIDILAGHLQHMMVMNFVYPITAMLCGFITAYPINWWLIKKKIKEKM